MTDLVLWAGTLGSAGFEERLSAAVAGGYTAMSVFPWDCRPPDSRGSRASTLRAQAEAAGMHLIALDPVSTWLPSRRLPRDPGLGTGAPSRARLMDLFDTYSVDEAMTMASELGAELISVIDPGDTPVDTAVAIDALARTCDVAARHGLRVQLEFMPFSGIPDLRTAWNIVRSAGRPNAGLVLDSWHYFRSGPDHDLLASLPPGTIFSVQLSDGPSDAETDLWLAASHSRLSPGSGTFDLAGLLAILTSTQPDAVIGPEVVSSENTQLTPREAATRVAQATAGLIPVSTRPGEPE